MTEHEVRRSVETIFRSEQPAMQKVRAFVRLLQQVRLHAEAVHQARDLTSRTADSQATAHLDRLARSLRMLHDEVRLAAWNVMIHSPEPVRA